jgi:predicted  nucleic acid-binding Zn-ribbon protein
MNLAKAAFIDKRVSQLEEIASAKPVTALDVLKGKMEKIRNRVDDHRGIYGRDDSLSTSIVGQEQLKQIRDEIKNLKKQKQKLNDEILELNIKTEIPLSEDVVNTLQSEGLI